jgi:hypothetical protein
VAPGHVQNSVVIYGTCIASGFQNGGTANGGKLFSMFQQFHLYIWSSTESALHHAVLHDRMAVSYDPSISWFVYKLSFLFYLLKSDVRIGDVDGCYGKQTGSGKTHTMQGQMPGSNSIEYVPTEDRGITPRIFEQLFS